MSGGSAKRRESLRAHSRVQTSLRWPISDNFSTSQFPWSRPPHKMQPLGVGAKEIPLNSLAMHARWVRALLAMAGLVAFSVGCKRAPPAQLAADGGSSPRLSSSAELDAADAASRAKAQESARDAMRALSAKLVALRDATDGAECARFEPLGPREQHAGAASRNECAPATNVHCLQTGAGYFVPIANPYAPSCAWALWFVPNAPGVPIAQGYDGFVETSDQFTLAMTSEDLDRDGVVDGIVLREDKTPRAGKALFLVRPGAQPSQTPFTELRDIDHDGRSDGISTFVKYLSGDHDQVSYLRGPTIVLHRTIDDRFSLLDDPARRARQSACQAPLMPIVSRRAGGRINQDETARRAVCSIVGGIAAATVRQALASGCLPVHEADPSWDCDVFEQDLGVFIDRAAQLVEWGKHSL